MKYKYDSNEIYSQMREYEKLEKTNWNIDQLITYPQAIYTSRLKFQKSSGTDKYHHFNLIQASC